MLSSARAHALSGSDAGGTRDRAKAEQAKQSWKAGFSATIVAVP